MMTISEGLRRIRNVHNMGVHRYINRGESVFEVFYPDDKNKEHSTIWEDIEDAVISAGRMRHARMCSHSMPMRA